MESKDSKAQLEVWEWKEKIYTMIKDMPLEQGVELIMEQTKQTAESLKIKYAEKLKSRKT